MNTLGWVAVAVDRLQASSVVENSPDHLFILLSSIQQAPPSQIRHTCEF